MLQQHIDDIYRGMIKLPETYDEWKQVIISKDELMRRRESCKRASGWVPKWQQKGGNQSQNTTAPAPKSIPVQDCRDGTGQTFGGQGRPMEIDRARQPKRKCYRCGSEDHLIRDCPEPPKMKVRSWEPREENAPQEHRASWKAPKVESKVEEVPERTSADKTAVRGWFANATADERAALAKELGFLVPAQ